MKTPDRDILSRLGINLLTEIIAAARRGHPFYEQLGISRHTFDDLSSMNISELHSVANTLFFDIEVNERALNLSVQRVLQSRDRNTLIDDAIRLGASRQIMQLLANMSYNEFNRRRADLNIDDIRWRPTQLTTDDYDNLATLHSQYGRTQESGINSGLEHLNCLVFLSERTKIDLNRIYSYYYMDNQRLFITDAAKPRD